MKFSLNRSGWEMEVNPSWRNVLQINSEMEMTNCQPTFKKNDYMGVLVIRGGVEVVGCMRGNKRYRLAIHLQNDKPRERGMMCNEDGVWLLI